MLNSVLNILREFFPRNSGGKGILKTICWHHKEIRIELVALLEVPESSTEEFQVSWNQRLFFQKFLLSSKLYPRTLCKCFMFGMLNKVSTILLDPEKVSTPKISIVEWLLRKVIKISVSTS